jgi:hypothetical protein
VRRGQEESVIAPVLFADDLVDVHDPAADERDRDRQERPLAVVAPVVARGERDGGRVRDARDDALRVGDGARGPPGWFRDRTEGEGVQQNVDVGRVALPQFRRVQLTASAPLRHLSRLRRASDAEPLAVPFGRVLVALDADEHDLAAVHVERDALRAVGVRDWNLHEALRP